MYMRERKREREIVGENDFVVVVVVCTAWEERKRHCCGRKAGGFTSKVGDVGHGLESREAELVGVLLEGDRVLVPYVSSTAAQKSKKHAEILRLEMRREIRRKRKS